MVHCDSLDCKHSGMQLDVLVVEAVLRSRPAVVRSSAAVVVHCYTRSLAEVVGCAGILRTAAVAGIHIHVVVAATAVLLAGSRHTVAVVVGSRHTHY